MSRSARPSDWMSNLPFVLLGIRSSSRDHSAVTPAHLVLGGPLRLPGEFFHSMAHTPPPASDFVDQLRHNMQSLAPFHADFHNVPRQSRSSLPKSLSACAAVFVRVDAVKRPLTQPYVGPYEVLERGEKTFILLKSGKPWTVSVDRLKPFLSPVVSAPPSSSSGSSSSAASSPPPSTTPSSTSVPVSPASTDGAHAGASPLPPPPAATSTTRYGRRVHPPARYNA